MSGPDFAGVCAAHWNYDLNATDDAWACECGEILDFRTGADLDQAQRAHLSAALHVEVARWLAEDVVATLREMSAKQFDRTGPYNARGAAIWDVAAWLETTAALTAADPTANGAS